ncbi:hypothetical protein A6R70_21480 [Agrobacterium rubi]|nr:hypothetical protein [Agrobacterium rubi]
MSVIKRLLIETSSALRAARGALSGEDQASAAAFADELEKQTRSLVRSKVSRSLDVRGLRYGPMLLDGENLAGSNLVDAVRHAFCSARWSEFYEETSWSQTFIENFAAGECVGPSGYFHSSKLIVGLFIFGPNTNYPAHAHAAEEFYIVVEGEADFQKGASAFIARRKGDVVLHASEISHAIRTASTPLLAIYGWRGSLQNASWYRENMADENEPKKYPTMI